LASAGEGRCKSSKTLTSEVVIQHPSQNRVDLAKKCPKQTKVAGGGGAHGREKKQKIAL